MVFCAILICFEVLKSSLRLHKNLTNLLTIMLHVLSSKATLRLTCTLKYVKL